MDPRSSTGRWDMPRLLVIFPAMVTSRCTLVEKAPTLTLPCGIRAGLLVIIDDA